MNKGQVLTYAALLILPFSLFQWYIGYPLIAKLSAIIAFLFSYCDLNKITGKSQFLAIYLSAVTSAFITASITHDFWLQGLSILVSSVGFSIRLALIRTLSYSRFKYLELSLLPISSALFIAPFILHLDQWAYSFSALVFLILHAARAFLIIHHSKQITENKPTDERKEQETMAPDFYLPDYEGNFVSLSNYKHKRNVLLIFVRGDWCPYCHMILRTYMRSKEKFQEKNVMLLAIGPDPIGVNREMAIKLGLEYKVLSDQNMSVAHEYGIKLADYQKNAANPNSTEPMPLPASFLINTEGKIIYTSRSKRVGEFLDPNLIFPILESLN